MFHANGAVTVTLGRLGNTGAGVYCMYVMKLLVVK